MCDVEVHERGHVKVKKEFINLRWKPLITKIEIIEQRSKKTQSCERRLSAELRPKIPFMHLKMICEDLLSMRNSLFGDEIFLIVFFRSLLANI